VRGAFVVAVLRNGGRIEQTKKRSPFDLQN
jgi:hypothetical protein